MEQAITQELSLRDLRTHRDSSIKSNTEIDKKLRLVNKMKADQPEKYNASVNIR